MKALLHRAYWPLLFVLLCGVPYLTDGYSQYIVNLVLVYVVVAIGLNFIIGYAGLFAFSNAAFMALGAYFTVLLASRLGVHYFLALPIAGLATGLVGCAVGVPALRVSGLYLAMVTMAFGELVQWTLIHWKSVSGGVDGLTVRAPVLLGMSFRSDGAVFYAGLVVTFVMILLARAILASGLGRAFVAVRESEILARCNGIDVAFVKTAAFGLSAFYAGIGGALMALTLHYISPGGFGIGQTILHFCIIVIGGIGSLAGSIIGALLLTALPELLRETQSLQEIAYGVLLVVFMIFAPRGIAGLLRDVGLLPREILVRNWRAIEAKHGHRDRAARPGESGGREPVAPAPR